MSYAPLPLLVIALVVSFSFLPAFGQPDLITPITGTPVPGLESYDQAMTTIITKYGIPGAALAVAYHGRLVYSRGFGYADLATKNPVAPDSLFRIASTSKAITAVTILRLVEEGKLDLDARAFKILNIEPPGGQVLDQRIWNITIRELLEHSGGWGRKPFDPMFLSTSVAAALGDPAPASCETTIRYVMMTSLLDFEPGTRFAYSNFGYCVLGRIIERITGARYEDYVRTEVLAPMGIADMQIGHTQSAFRALKEVHYYDADNRSVQSVFQNITDPVPYPYGGFYIEALDSVGGWIASAQDLVRFAVSIDGARPPAYLQPQTVDIMLARNSALWPSGDHWYALGWDVKYPSWWHDGGVRGSRSYLVRMPNGVAWAALFNTCRCATEEDFGPDVDQSLRNTFDGIKSWPSWDLFQVETTTSFTASSYYPELTETTTTLTTTYSTSTPVATTSAVSTLVQTTRAPETETATSQQLTASFLPTVLPLLVGTLLAIVVACGIYLRRRGKQNG